MPNYVIQQAKELASALVMDRIRFSDDHYSYQVLRDNQVHEAEQKRESGELFLDKEMPTKEQFARGICYAELESINQNGRRKPSSVHEMLRWFIDTYSNDESAGDDGYDPLEDHTGFDFQDVDGEVEERRRRPLRKRRKPGPKPLGDHVMTTAERVQKHRAKRKAQKEVKRPPTQRARAQ